jgi:SAM-dependent methyltransferase
MDSFLTKRQEFAKYIGRPELYEFIDQFGLYAGVQTIGNKIFTYELLKQTVGIPGDIVEFGSWKGGNLLFLTKLISLLEPNSPKRVLSFDNFSGLPEPSNKDGEYARAQIGNYKGNEQVLRKAIALFGFDHKIDLVVGDALETIPKWRESNEHSIFSFCYLDFDLYDPTVKALELIDDSLAIGGVVVFDEALTNEWPGETLAVKEYLKKTKKKFRMLSNTLSQQPTLAIIRES